MATSATLPDVTTPDEYEIWHDGTQYNYVSESDLYAASPATTPKGTLTNLYEGSLAVPATFFGIHIHRYATGARTTPTPTVQADLWRTHDASVFWPDIETSAGVYDWTDLDRLVSSAEALGMAVCYTIAWTPTFYASDLTKYSQYGSSQGHPTPPTDIANFENFVTALATRYAGRIAYYEVWNEPNYRSSTTVGTWFGTTAQLVALANSAYTIIKAIDPAATVLSPPYFAETNGILYTNGVDSLNAYLVAGGGAYCDVIGYHFYLAYNRNPSYLTTYIASVKAVMTANGVGAKPLWNAEFGNQEIYTFNGQEPMAWSYREQFMARCAVMSLLNGCESFIWYSYDATTYDAEGRTHGMLDDNNTPQMVAGYNALRNALHGKTLVRVNKHVSGQLYVVTSDGGTYTV